MTSHRALLLAIILVALTPSSRLGARPVLTAAGHDGVTLRIERYDPPLVIYEGELEIGRRTPSGWMPSPRSTGPTTSIVMPIGSRS